MTRRKSRIRLSARQAFQASVVAQVVELHVTAQVAISLEPSERNLLVLLSPRDKVVSPAATKQAFERIEAPQKALIEIEDSGDPSNHVLAGDILAPESTSRVAAIIIDFIRATESEELRSDPGSNTPNQDQTSN